MKVHYQVQNSRHRTLNPALLISLFENFHSSVDFICIYWR
jgi:hypothetical protein